MQFAMQFQARKSTKSLQFLLYPFVIFKNFRLLRELWPALSRSHVLVALCKLNTYLIKVNIKTDDRQPISISFSCSWKYTSIILSSIR